MLRGCPTTRSVTSFSRTSSAIAFTSEGAPVLTVPSGTARRRSSSEMATPIRASPRSRPRTRPRSVTLGEELLQPRLDGFQRLVVGVAPRAAREGEVRLAAGAPADDRPGRLEERRRRDPSRDQVARCRPHEQRLSSAAGAEYDRRAALVLQTVRHVLRERSQRVGLGVLDRDDELGPADLARRCRDVGRALPTALAILLPPRALELLHALDELTGALGGVRGVGAAAELDRVVADLHDADEIAVFLAEQCDRALVLRFVERRLVDRDLVVIHGFAIRELLGLLEHVPRHRRVVREVEPQPAGRDQRTRLPRVFSQDVPEGPVDDVRGGMRSRCRLATTDVDLAVDHVAGRSNDPLIPDLSAGLRVERRAVHNEPDLLSLVDVRCPAAVRQERDQTSVALETLVPHELRLAGLRRHLGELLLGAPTFRRPLRPLA